MKKSEIKLGVVYAFQRGEWDSPSPVVFLSLDLYRDPARSERDQMWCRPAANYDKRPKRGEGFSGYDVGYPVVRGKSYGKPIVAKLMARLDAATVLRDGLTKQQQAADISTGILISMSQVVGVYDEVVAERDAAMKRKNEIASAAEAERARDKELRAALAARFDALGLKVTPDYGHSDRLVMDLSVAATIANWLEGQAR